MPDVPVWACATGRLTAIEIEAASAISLPARARLVLNWLLKIQITPFEAAQAFLGHCSSQDSYDARFV
jgi:hypothetical protein